MPGFWCSTRSIQSTANQEAQALAVISLHHLVGSPVPNPFSGTVLILKRAIAAVERGFYRRAGFLTALIAATGFYEKFAASLK